jgi:hypothetical protein
VLRALFRIHVEVQLRPDYVLLTCSGPFSRGEAFRINDDGFRIAAEAGLRNILIDARKVRGRVPSIFDRYEIGTNIARAWLDQLPRVRLALVGHEPLIHPDRFGEIVARNRGADTRVFTVEDEALRWLLAA